MNGIGWNDIIRHVVFRRSYSRPKEDGTFETYEEMVDRVIRHQRWLWERQLGRKLNEDETGELERLRRYMLERKVLFGGRILWLGGTELVKRKEICMFNCTYVTIKTVNDVVDAFWALLNGCGVGFRPEPGVLNGFSRRIPEIQVVRSTRTEKGGCERNVETWDPDTKTWTIKIGDSGEAWAKSIGKLLAGKYPARKLVLDFSEIRPAGTRLAGYGYISSGDNVISEEYVKICQLLNRKAGRILSHIDILDIVNHLGVIQTGRRGAEIALYPFGREGWKEFATAKKDYWKTGNEQRAQSNNSLLFETKPSRNDLRRVLDMMVESGGSEPGIVNFEELKRRAPYAEGVNPCVTGDTMVMTDEGPRRVVDLVGKPFRAVVNGRAYDASGFWKTGTKPVFRVVTDRGFFVRATADHKILTPDGWVEVKDLVVGESRVVLNGSDDSSVETAVVVDVVEDGVEDVYDCTVDEVHCFDANGIVVHNCSEILLPDKGVCNLCDVNVAAFDDFDEMLDAIWLIARANYRQTLVRLEDGILQRAWHENQEFLRLCGVSLTGVAMRPDLGSHDFRMMRSAAVTGAVSMARELGTQLPKAVTTVKPSGTVSRVLGVTHGMHRPPGRYLFNHITFSVHDEIVGILEAAGYEVRPNPLQKDGVLVKFPLHYPNVPMDVVDGKHVNMERAVDQLERYRTLMRYWCDHNVSVTISYDPHEIGEICDWLYEKGWDDYVGVSFLPRTDPTKTAEDLGYPYLPLEVTTEEAFREYVERLKPVDRSALYGRDTGQDETVDVEDGCVGGVCPVR